MKISNPTFATNKPTITVAIGSKALNPSSEPPIPINAATEDRASDLWCHASAFSDGEFIFLATFIVILY